VIFLKAKIISQLFVMSLSVFTLSSTAQASMNLTKPVYNHGCQNDGGNDGYGGDENMKHSDSGKGCHNGGGNANGCHNGGANDAYDGANNTDGEANGTWEVKKGYSDSGNGCHNNGGNDNGCNGGAGNNYGSNGIESQNDRGNGNGCHNNGEAGDGESDDGCMNGGCITNGGTTDNGGTTTNDGYTKTEIKVDATPISSTTNAEPTTINGGLLPKTATAYPFAGVIGASLVALGYILRKYRNKNKDNFL
jgi:hypothetical protein